MNAKIKNRYHWVIAAVAVIEMLVCGGIINSLSGLFLIPVTEELGISRGDFSMAISLSSMMGFLCNLISGVLFMKFGYRKLISVCLVISAAGLCLFGSSHGMLTLCVAALMLGTSNGLGITVGAARIVGSWFHRHHGLVLGIVTAASGLGGSLFSLVLSGLIEGIGWRKAYFSAAAFFVGTAVLVFLIVRSRPQDIGLKPYGEGYMPKRKSKPQKTDDHWLGFTFEQLKKKPIFYLLILGTFLSCGCSYMAFSVIAPHVQDCGMGAEFAATVQSVVLFGLAASKLGFGYLSDRIGVKASTMITLAANTASLVLLALVDGPVSAVIAALVFSLGLTLTGIVAPLLTPALLGYQSGGKAMGIVLAMAPASNMLASPLCNSLRDTLGSYVPVFWGTAAVSVGVIVLYLIMYAMSAKDRKEYENNNNVEEVHEI